MNRLCKLLEGCGAVSVAGLCKNAGKTTVLNHIISGMAQAGTPLGLTSIGRDGEDLDIVTGTPKPGIYVREGTVIATAQGLLRHCDITREIIENTCISTPLGDVIIVRALSDGFVQLAGPSVVGQLVEIKARFFALGAQKVIIDGAFGRKTLCSPELCEAVVLCVGASCAGAAHSGNMARVVSDARHCCRVLMLPEIADAALAAAMEKNSGAHMILLGEAVHVLDKSADLESALREWKDTRLVYAAGALTDGLVRPLAVPGVQTSGVTLVARDTARVLISADMLEKLEARGTCVRVLERAGLAAVTVNPFSAYGMHFDKLEFKQAMQRALPVPVFDIADEQE